MVSGAAEVVASRSPGLLVHGAPVLPSLPAPRFVPLLGPSPHGGRRVMSFQGGTRAALGKKPGEARALSLPRGAPRGLQGRPGLGSESPWGLLPTDKPFSSDGNAGRGRTLIWTTSVEGG